MGMYLKINIEYKEQVNNELVWTGIYSDIFKFSSGSLHARLAGVNYNKNITPLAKPRGLPRDMCEEMKDEYESDYMDIHSFSYLTIKELVNDSINNPLINDIEDNMKIEIINPIISLLKCIDEYDINIEEDRIVFWFY